MALHHQITAITVKKDIRLAVMHLLADFCLLSLSLLKHVIYQE